jgi:hypothetical protein
MCDYIETKTIHSVEIQKNGIIRKSDGWIIGRLCESVEYDNIDKNGDPRKSENIGLMIRKEN